jgi:hypothetical protein
MDRFVTKRQAAQAAGVSVRTLERDVEQGIIELVHWNGRSYLSPNTFEFWYGFRKAKRR